MQVIKLPFKVKKEILACGADLKGGFCFAKSNHAYVSNGFGDLSEISNLERYYKEIEKVRRAFKLNPKIIACDLHPEYFSTKFAQNYYKLQTTNYKLQYIQHHHAHIASCMLDNKIKGRVIGVSFNGTGFGSDNRIWGGEFLLAGFNRFERVFHLDYIPMPGGEMAIREPWRMALSYLYKTYGDKFLNIKIPFSKRLNKEKTNVLIQMIKNNVNSPLTSSMGRFFDGVASLIGIKDKVGYEAEAAISLEKMADIRCKGRYKYKIKGNGENSSVIKVEEIIRGIVKDLRKKEKGFIISSRFHNTIAYIVKDIAYRISKREKIKEVVFSGGVFQNKYLITRLEELFKDSRLKVYFHKSFSTTDASIVLGQLAIANTKMGR